MTNETGTQLAIQSAGNEIATQTDSASISDIWQSLVEMAKDPAVDADKLKALTDIQGTMIAQANAEKDREAKARFDRAFAVACSRMPIITKDSKIEHNGRFIGWFKKYEDIRGVVDDVIRPLGLNVSHDSSAIDGGKGGILVWSIITYVDSEYTWTEERAKIPVPPDTGGAKGAGQALGSSKTYGERYSLTGAFGIVQKGLDRDGSAPEPGQKLSSAQSELLRVGEQKAAEGAAAYGHWVKSIPNELKGWLIASGNHDRFVGMAK